MSMSIREYGGFIVKKSTSLLLSGILVSGMVLGTIVTPVTVSAATDNTAVTQADEEVTVLAKYYLRGEASGTLKKPFATQEITGKVGSPITEVPKDYAIIKGQNPVFSATEPNPIIEIAKKASATVNYIAPDGTVLKTLTLNGAEGDYYSLTSELPNNYYWDNDGEGGISLQDGKTYNLPVSESVANTVVFKTSNGTEIGSTTIRGDKVGDTITLSGGQIPYGYTTKVNSVTLQETGSTQVVTVTKNAAVTPFKGVVTVKSNIYAAYLYDVNGNEIKNRAVSGDSAWRVSNKMVLNDKTYYQVSTNEWIPADNVTVTSQDANNAIDGNNTVTKSDVKSVTTKNLGETGAVLYKADGSVIKNRALGSNSAWATDKMATINGVTMYRVATDEWVPATSITK